MRGRGEREERRDGREGRRGERKREEGREKGGEKREGRREGANLYLEACFRYCGNHPTCTHTYSNHSLFIVKH